MATGYVLCHAAAGCPGSNCCQTRGSLWLIRDVLYGAAFGGDSNPERGYFNAQVASGTVPAFNYLVLLSDHTNGVKPGARTPRSMVAENDSGLGQIVDLISHSSVWRSSASRFCTRVNVRRFCNSYEALDLTAARPRPWFA